MVRVLAFAAVLLLPAMLGSATSSSTPAQSFSESIALAKKIPLLRARGAEAASHLALPGQKKRKQLTLLA